MAVLPLHEDPSWPGGAEGGVRQDGASSLGVSWAARPQARCSCGWSRAKPLRVQAWVSLLETLGLILILPDL